MSIIESAPKVSKEEMAYAIINPSDDAITSLVDKINKKYEYWNTVKYQKTPSGLSSLKLWTYVKAARLKNQKIVWNKFDIKLSITDEMQKICHNLEETFNNLIYKNKPSWTDENYYLNSSLMEEAIYSSIMEGAATTRKVAKYMLRNKIKPKDKSQQMIANNYQTIQYIVQHQKEPLTEDSFLYIHHLITEKTLSDTYNEGKFRTNDEVVVENGITHETIYNPPSYLEIPAFVHDLCSFFNDAPSNIYIHPIIRAIIIHFMIAFVHPFVDGNGRTSRAMFYWYMLKHNYNAMEFLAFSRVIALSKKSYEKAFIYTEADNNDIGYFVMYNLQTLKKSLTQLQNYLLKKQSEKQDAVKFLKIKGINLRQAQIIKMFAGSEIQMITVKDVQTKFLISPTTAKKDIIGLMERGLLDEVPLNKVKHGYIKSDNFEKTINKL